MHNRQADSCALGRLHRLLHFTVSTSAAQNNSLPHQWSGTVAKLLVGLTLGLVLLGGLVTTFGAGMAVATWPTIHGQMNPPGWWEDPHVLLEHSHRLVAICVGIVTAILCSLVWRNGWGLLAAVILSGLADAVGRPLHMDGNLIAQLRIWPPALVFILTLWFLRKGSVTLDRWLVLLAYISVCIQATLGGLRVTQETAGQLDSALVFRVVHGCFAQFFLALTIVLATRLSPRWNALSDGPDVASAGKIQRMAFAAIGLYFIQLALAATLRHSGAGLIIPVWPAARPDGGWLPVAWSPLVVISFLHTRVIAFLMVGHVIGLGIRTMRSAVGQPLLRRPGIALLALVALQFLLGAMVIWKGRHPHVTTVHVFNGAAILATSVLLATRAGRVAARVGGAPRSQPELQPA